MASESSQERESKMGNMISWEVHTLALPQSGEHLRPLAVELLDVSWLWMQLPQPPPGPGSLQHLGAGAGLCLQTALGRAGNHSRGTRVIQAGKDL